MRTNADDVTSASLPLRAFCFLLYDCSVYNTQPDYPKSNHRRVNAEEHGRASIPKAKIGGGNTDRCNGHAAICSCAKVIFAQKECVCIQAGESRKARALKFSQNESNARCVLPYAQRP